MNKYRIKCNRTSSDGQVFNYWINQGATPYTVAFVFQKDAKIFDELDDAMKMLEHSKAMIDNRNAGPLIYSQSK